MFKIKKKIDQTNIRNVSFMIQFTDQIFQIFKYFDLRHCARFCYVIQ